jgi:septum formation protein
VKPAEIEEAPRDGELPGGLVHRLAKAKAVAVAEKEPARFVLAADTVVVLPSENLTNGIPVFDALEGQVLGKPQDESQAKEMLRMLSGRAHYVISGFNLSCIESKVSESGVAITEVLFGKLSEDTVSAYAASGEGLDKAGAYAVQGVGACLVERVSGSYTNVVGLPLKEVLNLLEKYRLWSPSVLARKVV